MIRFALPFMIEPLSGNALLELLDRELGSWRVLDDDGRDIANPRLILHVLSGNIPATAAVPIATSLAVKSAALVKAASGDRVFPSLFQRSIAEVDPELGSAVAACYWVGGNRACENVAFAAADLVVASGSDASIADARTRCPGRFIGHGHKVSFALVTSDVLDDEEAATRTADSLALDVSIWDQRGCLSPQICFVEGDFDAACRFAERLVAPLSRLAVALPPGHKTIDEQSAIQRFRSESEWHRIEGKPAALFASTGSTDWTVAVESPAEFRPTPLCRSLRVCALPSLAELPRVLAPARTFLEAAGLAASGRRETDITAMLGACGVHWVCPLGRMQRPPLSWPQGGRPRIADWITWSGQDERLTS